MKLKSYLSALKQRRIHLPLWVVLAVVITLAGGLGGGLAYRQHRQNQQAQQQRLEQFQKEQQHKRADLARAFEEARKAEEARRAKEIEDQNKKIAEIERSLTFSTPSCAQLQNRPNIIINSNSCLFDIKATHTIRMAVVMVADHPNSPSSQSKVNLKTSAGRFGTSYINTYMAREAARHKVAAPNFKLDTFGPYQSTRSLVGIFYRTNQDTWISTLKATSEKSKVPENNYDLVHYIYFDNEGGSALPVDHRAFSGIGWDEKRDAAVYIHETLHLFGASDKYLDTVCNTKPPDIMCHAQDTDIDTINSITAKEIGW